MAATNEAYDLELFSPREPKLRALADNKKAARDKQRRNRRQSLMTTVFYLVLGVVLMAVIGYFITGRVRLTEMNKTLADSQAQLRVLQSERVRLEAELAAKTSAEQVDQYALENGMAPAESSQIYYISAADGDQVTVSKEALPWLQRICQAITALFR